MAKEQAQKFFTLLEADPELQDRIREKTPEEVAQIACGLSFDVTADELLETAEEMKKMRAQQSLPEHVGIEALGRAVGGRGDDHTDGKELGCFFRHYDYEWQEKNKVFCSKTHLCEYQFYVCLGKPNRSHVKMDS